MRFKAFLSYSHAVDGKLAPALEVSLQHIARPWYRMRTMHVFRDEANLSVNPTLWSSIQHALQQSEYFLLLASPAAASSVWVAREVRWWLANRDAKRLLILLTEGQIYWDERVGCMAR